MYKERAFQGWEQVAGDTPELGYCTEEEVAVAVAYCAEAEVEVEVFRLGMVASLWATCCWTRLARAVSSMCAPPCGS